MDRWLEIIDYTNMAVTEQDRRLARLILQQKLMDVEQVKVCLEEMENTELALADLVVRMGHLQTPQLEKLLEEVKEQMAERETVKNPPPPLVDPE